MSFWVIPDNSIESDELLAGADAAALGAVLAEVAFVPAAALVLAAIGIVFAPHLGSAAEAAALRFQDQTAYNATVLSGARVAHPAGIFPAGTPGSPWRTWSPESARPPAR